MRTIRLVTTYKNLILLISVFLLVNCKTMPKKGYEQIKANSFKKHIDSLIISPKTKLEISKFQSLSLGSDDPTIYYNLDSNSEVIESVYETAQIDIDKPGIYSIEFESICYCLGFEKLIFVPLIELRYKEDNNKISVELLENRLLNPSFTLSSRLKKTWIFNAKERGSYLLLFYSDNSKLNYPLGQQESIGYYGTLTYTVSTFKSNVYGNFRVKINML